MMTPSFKTTEWSPSESDATDAAEMFQRWVDWKEISVSMAGVRVHDVVDRVESCGIGSSYDDAAAAVGWMVVMLFIKHQGKRAAMMEDALRSQEYTSAQKRGGMEISDLEAFVRGLKVGSGNQGPGIVHVSHKEIMTTALLMEKVEQVVLQRENEVKKSGSFEQVYVRMFGEGGAVQEFMWELASKMRVQVSEAEKALRLGVIDQMLVYIRADHLGGWREIVTPLRYTESNPLLKESRITEKILEVVRIFTAATTEAETALSVLHEICQYRSGCEAVASHRLALLTILSLPLADFRMCRYTLMNLGQAIVRKSLAGGSRIYISSYEEMMHRWYMLEQAAADTIGSCLNGLDKREDLRATAQHLVSHKPRAFLSALKQSGEFCDQMDESVDQVDLSNRPYDTRFVDVSATAARLLKMIDGKSRKSWKSLYCMDHSVRGDVDSEQPETALYCAVCLKPGRLGEDLKLCARCKSVAYCSVECQRKNWPLHKKECVQQSRAAGVGTDNTQAHTAKWLTIELQRQQNDLLDRADEQWGHGRKDKALVLYEETLALVGRQYGLSLDQLRSQIGSLFATDPPVLPDETAQLRLGVSIFNVGLALAQQNSTLIGHQINSSKAATYLDCAVGVIRRGVGQRNPELFFALCAWVRAACNAGTSHFERLHKELKCAHRLMKTLNSEEWDLGCSLLSKHRLCGCEDARAFFDAAKTALEAAEHEQARSDELMKPRDGETQIERQIRIDEAHEAEHGLCTSFITFGKDGQPQIMKGKEGVEAMWTMYGLDGTAPATEQRKSSPVATASDLRRCSGVGCNNVESSPREFKLCAGCKVCQYCSRECQIKHWKLQHKAVCCRDATKKEPTGVLLKSSPPLLEESITVEQAVEEASLAIKRHYKEQLESSEEEVSASEVDEMCKEFIGILRGRFAALPKNSAGRILATEYKRVWDEFWKELGAKGVRMKRARGALDELVQRTKGKTAEEIECQDGWLFEGMDGLEDLLDWDRGNLTMRRKQ